jgi:SprT-like family
MGTEAHFTRELYDQILSSAPEGCRYAIFNKVKVAVPGKKCQATTGKMVPPSIQKLEIGQHSPRDLVTHFKATSQRRRSQLSPLQKSAMKYFTNDLPQSLEVAKLSSEFLSYFPRLNVVMWNYFDLFDQLFFFGSLQKYCKVVLSPDCNEGSKGDFRYDEKSNDCIITIYDTLPESTFEDRVQDYVGTLLHEMIHAFISIYSQRGDGYCPDHGYTGHGLAWQFIAHAAEQAVSDPKLLGLQLDLGRGSSLYLEMYVTEEYSGVTGLDGSGQVMDPERWGFKRIDEEKKKGLRILFAEDITKELQQKVQNTPGVT